MIAPSGIAFADLKETSHDVIVDAFVADGLPHDEAETAAAAIERVTKVSAPA